MQSVTQFKDIADLVPVMIWATDEHGQCQWANREWTTFAGRASHEEFGDSWAHSIHPEDRDRILQEFHDHVAAQRRFALVYRMYNSAQQCYRWLLDTGAPVWNASRVFIGYFGTVVDMTEQKQLEDDLRATQARLQQETKNKLEFLSTMSHEIRTPLTCIIGMTELLCDSSAAPGESERLLRAIDSAAIHLRQLVSNFLDAAKFDKQGKVTLVNGPCNLLSALREVLPLFTAMADEKKLGLRLNCSLSFEECKVTADDTRWKQVVINIISNAIKFTEHGSVTVSLDKTQQDGQVLFMLSVCDTGCGIPVETRKTLFRPFGQGFAVSGHSQVGTGLGLYVVKHIVEAWGGTIDVLDNRPHGAVVQVSLPYMAPGGENAQYDEQQVALLLEKHGPTPSAFRVLLAEDNLSIQLILQRFLSHSGVLHLDIAVNGLEAVDMASQNAYDIVFMDCCMPLMDGFTAAQQIRQAADRPGLPVIIAVTALTSGSDRERCIAAGMDDFLPKPFTQAQVLKVLQYAIQTVATRRMNRPIQSHTLLRGQ